MKTVLLLHPKMLFYKVRVYNALSSFLAERGHRLVVWATEIEAQEESFQFECLVEPMNRRSYRSMLRRKNVSVVVNLLSRRTVGPLFYLYALLYARLSGRTAVYYGHGLNLSNSHRAIERFVSNVILSVCNSAILYGRRELKFLWPTNRRKVSIANNTLCLSDRDLVSRSRRAIKAKLGIHEDRVMLFSGRIMPRKKLDMLVKSFIAEYAGNPRIGLVIVGPGMPDDMASAISSVPNIHYFGAVYTPQQMSEIFSISDVLTVPGWLGLVVVEALYWGLPVISLDVQHAPEVQYLRHGFNALIVSDECSYLDTVIDLLSSPERLRSMSENARHSYENEARIERLCTGFLEGISAS